MKIPWTERAKIITDPEQIKKYYNAYHIQSVESVIDFIDRFCITVDPRKTDNRELPFELFEKQISYIRWLWKQYTDRNDGVVDKCRGIGMSWMNAAFSTYLLLFQKQVTISMYTYKADECHEKDNLDTLIETLLVVEAVALFIS